MQVVYEVPPEQWPDQAGVVNESINADVAALVTRPNQDQDLVARSSKRQPSRCRVCRHQPLADFVDIRVVEQVPQVEILRQISQRWPESKIHKQGLSRHITRGHLDHAHLYLVYQRAIEKRQAQIDVEATSLVDTMAVLEMTMASATEGMMQPGVFANPGQGTRAAVAYEAIKAQALDAGVEEFYRSFFGAVEQVLWGLFSPEQAEEFRRQLEAHPVTAQFLAAQQVNVSMAKPTGDDDDDDDDDDDESQHARPEIMAGQ